MATILDFNLLNFISPIILFLFVYIILYGLLSKVEMFGKSQGIRAFISFCMAILFLLVPPAGGIIRFFTPWFIVFVIFGMFLMLMFMFAGIKQEDLIKTVYAHGGIYGLVIAVVIILFLVSFSEVFGPGLFDYPGSNTTYWWDNVKGALFNTKILGILVILIIAAETIRQFGNKE